MNNYKVEFVDDDDLPEEQDWAMVHCSGRVYFLVKRSRLTPEVLEEAWEGFRKMAERPIPGEPLPV